MFINHGWLFLFPSTDCTNIKTKVFFLKYKTYRYGRTLKNKLNVYSECTDYKFYNIMHCYRCICSYLKQKDIISLLVMDCMCTRYTRVSGNILCPPTSIKYTCIYRHTMHDLPIGLF